MDGNRDSECAVLIEDTVHLQSFMNGVPFTVGNFPFQLRKRLMRQHIGLTNLPLTHPTSDLSSSSFFDSSLFPPHFNTSSSESQDPPSIYTYLSSSPSSPPSQYFFPKSPQVRYQSPLDIYIENLKQYNKKRNREDENKKLEFELTKLQKKLFENEDFLIDIIDPKNFIFWCQIALNNSEQHDKIDEGISYYRVQTIAEYNRELKNYQYKSINKIKNMKTLAAIQGVLVNWPLDFMSKEDLSPNLATRTLISNDLWV